MSTYFVYRIKCTTEGMNKTWTLLDTDPAPTTCPTNTAHTIDTSSVTVIKTVEDGLVKIREEDIDTGGHFRSETKVINCPTGPNVTQTENYSWPFPVSILELQFVSDEDNRGDVLTLSVGPQTIVGALTADCPTGATGANVSQTVVENLKIGFNIDLLQIPSTTEELGRILSVDVEGKKIYFETPTTQSFAAAGPTYVRQTAYTIKDYEIGPGHRYVVGDSKIGGSYIPKNVIVQVDYTNMGTIPKKFIAQIEYLY